jgi:hypothetical protein
MAVEIKKVSDEEWCLIHSRKNGLALKAYLNKEEIKELLEELRMEGF